MFSLLSLSKSKFLTRVALMSFVQHLCRTCVALLLHLCCFCLTRVALVSFVLHSFNTRAVCVALVLIVSGTRVVKQTGSYLLVTKCLTLLFSKGYFSYFRSVKTKVKQIFNKFVPLQILTHLKQRHILMRKNIYTRRKTTFFFLFWNDIVITLLYQLLYFRLVPSNVKNSLKNTREDV